MASNEEYYQPGDLVYQGKPFVIILRKDLWDEVCAGCFKGKSHLLFCKGCQVTKYCGKKCQKRAWSDHKVECPLLKNYTDHRYQFSVQMLGNIIMKLKGRDWKTVTEKVLDEEVSFDDLSASPDVDEEDLDILFKGIKIPLTAYIGQENMPDDAELFILFKKVMNNCFFNAEFAALFIGLSKFAVSCVPNCSKEYSYEELSIRAVKPIRKGSEQISISLRRLLFCTRDIQVSRVHDCSKMLRECKDCSQPYGLSPLTEILDPCNAPDVIKETKLLLRYVVSLIKLGYPDNMPDRVHLKILLEKQKGVLGDTNLLRIRTLAIKCLGLSGPASEIRDDLKELVVWVKAAWGDNCPELLLIHKQLIEVHLQLVDFRAMKNERKEIARLERICFGNIANFRKEDIRYPRDEDFLDREQFERGFKFAFEFLSGINIS